MSAHTTDNASRAGRALIALIMLAAVAGAQPQSRRVIAAASVVASPANGAQIIASLPVGVRITADGARGAWASVTLEGWLDQSVVGGKADAFPRSVSANAVRLRAAADGRSRTLAFLRRGVGLEVLGAQGRYLKVRRKAWVPESALIPAAADPAAQSPAPRAVPERAPAAAATSPAARPGPRGVRAVPAAAADESPALVAQAPGGAATPVPDGALRAGTNPAVLWTAPDARPLATLRPGAVVVPLARERGWVRVRIEGWVRERDMAPADTGLRRLVSAADLRADPEGTKGTVVRWEVDVLGLQTADGLRRDLSEGEPYLLAKGPVGEEALLYLVVPPSLLPDARQVLPMTRVLVTARVRIGRTEPTGVPVLDVMALARLR